MFSAEQIADIKARRANGETPREIAASYSVPARQIYRLYEAKRSDQPQKNPAAVAIMRQLGNVEPPKEILFDREQREIAALSQSNTGFICGDSVVPRYNSNAHRRVRICGMLVSFVGAILIAACGAPAHAEFASEYGRAVVVTHAQSFRYREVTPRYAGHMPRDARHRERYAACAKYGRLQCGCTASIIAFGQIVDGLPAVSEWLARFARTSPQVGAAAIWPGQHVEIVTTVNGDGTVDTRGSVGWSHVPFARLIFVDPRRARGRRIKLARR